jgi:3-hydroxyisobutyrate dehydrogenase-like beta-hydroxyacid dehydrogenase
VIRVSSCLLRPGMAPGKGYVDVSTVDAATSAAVAAAVRAAGALFLEAPVSGSKGPAEQGQLIFLTAGVAHEAQPSAALQANLGARVYPGSLRLPIGDPDTSPKSSTGGPPHSCVA